MVDTLAMALRVPLLQDRATKLSTQQPAIRQSIFTIVAKVDPQRIDAARVYLQRVDDAIRRQAALPFETFDMLHFCSFTLFEDAALGPYLVFESNIDGASARYLDALCASAAAGPMLHALYGFCLDYRAAAVDRQYLRRYFDAHIVHAATAFVGNVGRSARRIRAEAELVEQIHDYLDDVGSDTPLTAQAIVANVRGFVRDRPEYAWVWQRAPILSRPERILRWITAIVFSLSVVVALPLAWLPFTAFLAVLRRHEARDSSIQVGPGGGRLRTLSEREDRIVQNHMASLCYVKPGPFRRRTLKVVLYGANIVARISTNGKLLGLDSLHFAHWALIDNDSRLLFLTNYDGSWENYLDDFIEKAALGLTAIWSNTRDFPRTRFLFFGGARDEPDFKAIARKTQAYTNVWYSAYPTLTVSAVENNTAICDGLGHSAGFDDAAWLRRFG